MPENDTKPLESEASTLGSDIGRPFSAWIKIGTVAAASALAGGLAVAWFYRKTLNTLRQAETDEEDSDFGRRDAGTDNDT